MTDRGDSRESTAAVLAVAFGLLVIAVAALSQVVPRMTKLDGAALLEERFAACRLPEGVLPVEATRLAQGQEIVVLADPATWAERRAAEARDWDEVSARQGKSSFGHEGGFDGSRSRGGRGGGPGGFGGRDSGGASGAGWPEDGKALWADVEEGAPGQPPWEVALVWYPFSRAPKILRDQFGQRGFGDLSHLGPEGGKIAIASGPVAWQGYDTHYAIDRQFAEIGGKKVFRDTLRMNLTLGRTCCVLYAKWPQSAPASIEPVCEWLAGLVPGSPE